MSELLFSAIYALIYYPLGMIFTLTSGLRVEGSRHVPESGPVLLIANHQSYFDIILCGLASPRQVYFLARKSLWKNRLLGWIMDRFGTVPVDTTGLGRAGLEGILDRLKQGKVVLVYPEGERTHDGKLAPIKPGVSLLIRKVKCPIVPIGIAGAYETWPRNRRSVHFAPPFLNWKPARIGLSVGKPIDGQRLSELPREDMLAELQQALEVVVAKAERVRRAKNEHG
jgi:1-acyl-sn-glycerol-3-phosphate acyltransferase